MTALPKIIQNFDGAADNYDWQASVQAEIAANLVGRARSHSLIPHTILDIGCGTGFVAATAGQQWPHAHITALDHAPAMLRQAQCKMPNLETIVGDASSITFEKRFDIVFSSMMLHWLPRPEQALRLWQSWLQPRGRMYVSVLTEGSFEEWRELCARMGVQNGLWPMPQTHFIDALDVNIERQIMPITHASAHAFLQRLKSIGAATPHPNHRPLGTASMRRLLREAPTPFTATYQILYIESSSSADVCLASI